MVKRITDIDKNFINNCFENLKEGKEYTTSELAKILGFSHENSLIRNRSFIKLKDEHVFRINGITSYRQNIYVFNKEELKDMILDDLEARSGDRIRGIIR